MTTKPSISRSPARRWLQIVLLCSIFLSGGIIGAVVSRLVTRAQMIAMMKNPEGIGRRMLPQLRAVLQLDAEQFRQVEAIVRRHYSAMESIRSEAIPRLHAQFDQMQSEVSKVLNEQQQARWQTLSDSVERNYLPSVTASSNDK